MEIDTRGLKATVGWDLNKLGRQSNDYQVCGLNIIVRFRNASIGLRHTLVLCGVLCCEPEWMLLCPWYFNVCFLIICF